MRCIAHGAADGFDQAVSGAGAESDLRLLHLGWVRRPKSLLADGPGFGGGSEAIAIPRQAHIDVSPTNGQSLADAAIDARNVSGSAKRDIDAMLEKIDEYDEDGGCREACQAAASAILSKTNADFDKMLGEILKGAK